MDNVQPALTQYPPCHRLADLRHDRPMAGQALLGEFGTETPVLVAMEGFLGRQDNLSHSGVDLAFQPGEEASRLH